MSILFFLLDKDPSDWWLKSPRCKNLSRAGRTPEKLLVIKFLCVLKNLPKKLLSIFFHIVAAFLTMHKGDVVAIIQWLLLCQLSNLVMSLSLLVITMQKQNQSALFPKIGGISWCHMANWGENCGPYAAKRFTTGAGLQKKYVLAQQVRLPTQRNSNYKNRGL